MYVAVPFHVCITSYICFLQPTAFNITLARTYKWQTEYPRDQAAFLVALIRLFRKITGGAAALQLVGLNDPDAAPRASSYSTLPEFVLIFTLQRAEHRFRATTYVPLGMDLQAMVSRQMPRHQDVFPPVLALRHPKAKVILNLSPVVAHLRLAVKYEWVPYHVQLLPPIQIAAILLLRIGHGN